MSGDIERYERISKRIWWELEQSTVREEKFDVGDRIEYQQELERVRMGLEVLAREVDNYVKQSRLIESP